jgi:ligand-binding sensor domain-containing protein
VPIGDDGYAIAGADGTVLGYGDLGGLPPGGGGTHKKSPIVALAVTPDAAGYFTVAADGHVSAFGTAKSSGSLLPQRHTTPVVALVVDANERGYWIITAGGGVFAFGHAPNHGHISHSPTSPIVSAAGTADGGGYWLANAAGNVFAFGDAKKSGSLIGRHFSGSVVAIMASPFGGYWLVTSNGHLYGFGAAAQLKSPTSVSSQIVSATPTPDGAGCWLFESNGSVVAVGDAHFEGDPHGTLESRAVAISA